MNELQHPIPSGFGRDTTAREVLRAVSLAGRTMIVTGGGAGIGLETVGALAEAGAEVLVGARSIDKARAALGDLSVDVETLDLTDPKSIDAFAARFVRSGRPLHALVNNAGIMAVPLSRDARGLEAHLATNHVGHFQLTKRLWPALARAQGARIVSVSSRGHARSAFDFDDPNFLHRPYDKMRAYGQSKTANVLFAVAADARGKAEGIRALAVHPGAIETDLMRAMPLEEQQTMLERVKTLGGLKSVEAGAATSVWCATSPQLDGMGGVYCEDVDVASIVADDAATPNGVRAYALDADAAERLWAMSDAIVR